MSWLVCGWFGPPWILLAIMGKSCNRSPAFFQREKRKCIIKLNDLLPFRYLTWVWSATLVLALIECCCTFLTGCAVLRPLQNRGLAKSRTTIDPLLMADRVHRPCVDNRLIQKYNAAMQNNMLMGFPCSALMILLQWWFWTIGSSVSSCRLYYVRNSDENPLNSSASLNTKKLKILILQVNNSECSRNQLCCKSLSAAAFRKYYLGGLEPDATVHNRKKTLKSQDGMSEMIPAAKC